MRRNQPPAPRRHLSPAALPPPARARRSGLAPQRTGHDAPLLRRLRACQTHAQLARVLALIDGMRLPDCPLRDQLGAEYSSAWLAVERRAGAA